MATKMVKCPICLTERVVIEDEKYLCLDCGCMFNAAIVYTVDSEWLKGQGMKRHNARTG